MTGAGKLSLVTNLVEGTGPEYSERYNLSRSHKIYHGTGFKLRADARFASRSASEGWCPGA